MSDFIPKAIETEYNGYKFRSRLEARWAVVFDWLKVRYQYEPQGFELGDGIRYLPDFYLPEHKLYVEVKADANAAIASGDKLKRFADMVRANGEYFTVLYDVPNFKQCLYEKHKHQSTIFNHGKHTGLVSNPILRNTKIQSDWDHYAQDQSLKCPRCGYGFVHLEKIEPYRYDGRTAVKLNYTCEGCSERSDDGSDEIAFIHTIQNHTGGTQIKQSYYYIENNQLVILSGDNDDLLEDALYAGRTARFEHGEQPLTLMMPHKRLKQRVANRKLTINKPNN